MTMETTEPTQKNGIPVNAMLQRAELCPSSLGDTPDVVTKAQQEGDPEDNPVRPEPAIESEDFPQGAPSDTQDEKSPSERILSNFDIRLQRQNLPRLDTNVPVGRILRATDPDPISPMIDSEAVGEHIDCASPSMGGLPSQSANTLGNMHYLQHGLIPPRDTMGDMERVEQEQWNLASRVLDISKEFHIAKLEQEQSYLTDKIEDTFQEARTAQMKYNDDILERDREIEYLKSRVSAYEQDLVQIAQVRLAAGQAREGDQHSEKGEGAQQTQLAQQPENTQQPERAQQAEYTQQTEKIQEAAKIQQSMGSIDNLSLSEKRTLNYLAAKDQMRRLTVEFCLERAGAAQIFREWSNMASCAFRAIPLSKALDDNQLIFRSFLCLGTALHHQNMYWEAGDILEIAKGFAKSDGERYEAGFWQEKAKRARAYSTPFQSSQASPVRRRDSSQVRMVPKALHSERTFDSGIGSPQEKRSRSSSAATSVGSSLERPQTRSRTGSNVSPVVPSALHSSKPEPRDRITQFRSTIKKASNHLTKYKNSATPRVPSALATERPISQEEALKSSNLRPHLHRTVSSPGKARLSRQQTAAGQLASSLSSKYGNNTSARRNTLEFDPRNPPRIVVQDLMRQPTSQYRRPRRSSQVEYLQAAQNTARLKRLDEIAEMQEEHLPKDTKLATKFQTIGLGTGYKNIHHADDPQRELEPRQGISNEVDAQPTRSEDFAAQSVPNQTSVISEPSELFAQPFRTSPGPAEQVSEESDPDDLPMRRDFGRGRAFASSLKPLPQQRTGKLSAVDDTFCETGPIEDSSFCPADHTSRETSPTEGPLPSPADDTSEASSPEEFPFRGGEGRRRSYATLPSGHENEGADNEIHGVEERVEHTKEEADTENNIRNVSGVQADLNSDLQNVTGDGHAVQGKAESQDRTPMEASIKPGAGNISNHPLGDEKASAPEAAIKDSDSNSLYRVEDDYVPPNLRTASNFSAQALHTAGESSEDKTDDKNDTAGGEEVIYNQEVTHTMEHNDSKGSVDKKESVDKIKPDKERKSSIEKDTAVGRSATNKHETESDAENTYPPLSQEPQDVRLSTPGNRSPEQTTITLPPPPASPIIPLSYPPTALPQTTTSNPPPFIPSSTIQEEAEDRPEAVTKTSPAQTPRISTREEWMELFKPRTKEEWAALRSKAGLSTEESEAATESQPGNGEDASDANIPRIETREQWMELFKPRTAEEWVALRAKLGLSNRDTGAGEGTGGDEDWGGSAGCGVGKEGEDGKGKGMERVVEGGDEDEEEEDDEEGDDAGAREG